MYSNASRLIGREFSVGRGLQAALAGTVYAKVIDRGAQSHLYAAPSWPERLIETYAPIHAGPIGEVVGVAEFYQTTDELDEAMRVARQRTWGMVITTSARHVRAALRARSTRQRDDRSAARGASRTRRRSRPPSRGRNADLASKVKRAAARTTSSNEAFLRRVAADLHDGPAQDLGFAQMRVESMAKLTQDEDRALVARADLDAVRSALELGMADLRAICAGLQLPDLEPLSAGEVVARVVRDYERKTGATVTVEQQGALDAVALRVRITLYRLLQETLANGFRHAGGVDQRIALRREDGEIDIEVVDGGPGFDAGAVSSRTDGGLAGMRERVQALGGTFRISSAHGKGTRVHVRLPANVAEAGDE